MRGFSFYLLEVAVCEYRTSGYLLFEGKLWLYAILRLDFLKVLSGSGSWPQPEGLLSPAARQIYRRNFPPVSFIQSQTVLLMRRQSNPISRHETWLAVFKYKALVGVLSSSIWVLYQGRIFLAATERKNITNLSCFECAYYKDFIFLSSLSWGMETFLRAPKRLETNTKTALW